MSSESSGKLSLAVAPKPLATLEAARSRSGRQGSRTYRGTVISLGGLELRLIHAKVMLLAFNVDDCAPFPSLDRREARRERARRAGGGQSKAKSSSSSSSSSSWSLSLSSESAACSPSLYIHRGTGSVRGVRGACVRGRRGGHAAPPARGGREWIPAPCQPRRRSWRWWGWARPGALARHW
eukprot:scaffold2771_cov252-Pinguiococcus_pyrenoidosus.AAC.46